MQARQVQGMPRGRGRQVIGAGCLARTKKVTYEKEKKVTKRRIEQIIYQHQYTMKTF